MGNALFTVFLVISRMCRREKFGGSIYSSTCFYIYLKVVVLGLIYVCQPCVDGGVSCFLYVARCTKIGLFPYEYRFAYVLVSSTPDEN